VAKRPGLSGQHPTIEEIARYRNDLEASLRLYFSDVHIGFATRFRGYTDVEIASELAGRLLEVNTSTALTLLTALEAAFRIDYLERARRRKKDALSRAFRQLYGKKELRASLEDEILEAWKIHWNVPRQIIGDLRGAFKFRHWLAHGRYWIAKHGRDYDFASVFALAKRTLSTFPLES
jgi:hypothetical protein